MVHIQRLERVSEKDFVNSLKESCLSVWVDNKSGFGTFPLESMSWQALGKIPDLKPTWMTEENGIWITDVTLITDFIADFIQNWLEDNIRPELYTNMESTSQKFMNKQKFETEVTELFSSFFDKRADSFEEQLIKLDN